MKIAVIADGCGPHEMSVHIVEAANESEAITKVAETILQAWKEADPEMYEGWDYDEPYNQCSPTYRSAINNDDGNEVTQLWTVPLNIY